MNGRPRELRVRVAVTRDEGAAGPLSAALAAAGLEPVHCPATRTAPPEAPAALRAAANALEDFDWMVVASARAVAAVMEARRGAALPGSLEVAAVGEATAAALRAAGAGPVLTGTGAGALALCDALRAADAWPGRRVLVPRAAEGRPELADALRAWGADVSEVVAYRTLPRAPQAIVEAWRKAQPDAAVVASSSAARALVRALGPAALRELSTVVAIGATTAATLADSGIEAVVSEAADFGAVARCAAHTLSAGKEH